MDETVTRLEAADIAVVLKMLPHRYPFLMIDRVIDIRGDEFGIGIKNVTINEPQFMGHFPENPVFPGVLMIEGMAQTAGVMCIARTMSSTPELRRRGRSDHGGREGRGRRRGRGRRGLKGCGQAGR